MMTEYFMKNPDMSMAKEYSKNNQDMFLMKK